MGDESITTRQSLSDFSPVKVLRYKVLLEIFSIKFPVHFTNE